VVVETDGYRYHLGSVAFEADHRRDTWLLARGFEVLRFTYAQVVDDPADVFSLLEARLGRVAT